MNRRNWVVRAAVAMAAFFGLKGAASAATIPVRREDGFDPVEYGMHMRLWIPCYEDPKCCPVPTETSNGLFLGGAYITGDDAAATEFRAKHPGWKCVPPGTLYRLLREECS